MLCWRKSSTLVAFALAATLAPLATSAAGDHLVSFDDAITDGPQAPTSEAQASDDQGQFMIGREALEQPYVFYAIVEASSDNDPAIGSFTPPIRVRLHFHDGVLEIAQDRSALYPDTPGSPVAIVNRFPARDAGSAIEVDLNRSATVGDGYMPVTPSSAAHVEGFKATADVITWAQVLLTRPRAPTFNTALSETIKTIGFRYWLVKAHDQGFAPRAYPDEDQNRIGLFGVDETVRVADGQTMTHTNARIWDASKPITFYLHPTIPADLRPHVRQAILSWNQAFRKAVGHDVVTVVDGQDARILPGTPGGIVVYWADYPMSGPMQNVMALGWALPDPHTGEARAGYILVNGSTLRQQVHVFSAEAADLGSMGFNAQPTAASPVTTSITPPGGAELRFSLPADYPADAQAMLDAREFVDPSTLSPRDALAKMVREVIAHEAGHTLGLRHNFKGTADLAHVRSGEVTTTLMDYPVYLTSIEAPGPYDEAAIAYAYANAPAPSGGAAGPFLYATDEDVGIDPDANKFDEGEPLTFYTAQLSFYRKLRGAPRFATGNDYLNAIGDPLEHLRRYVDNSAPERSEKAFAAILGVLVGAPAAATPAPSDPPALPSPRTGPPADGHSPAPVTPPTTGSAGARGEVADQVAAPADFAAATRADGAADDTLEERRMAVLLLTATTLPWDKDHPLTKLSDAHAAIVAKALAEIVADGAEAGSLRQDALDGLVTLHRMSAYQALEAVDKTWAGIAGRPASDPAGEKQRELAIKVSKALASYY